MSVVVILKKDIKLLFFKKQTIIEPILLGLIIIFTFSLASSNLPSVHPTWIGTIFWICSLFCSVLIFRELYRVEEKEKVFEILLIVPISPERIWFSKTLSGFIALIFLQLFFLVLIGIFLKTNIWDVFLPVFLVIFLIDIGISVMSSFFGGAVIGSTLKDSLVTTILFPLEIPLVLGGIKIWSHLLGGGTLLQMSQWIHLILGFDAIFSGLCIFLFPYLFGED